MTKRTVLAIEDDASIQLLLKKKLEHDGFEVKQAVTLSEALAAVQENSADVILLDYMLGDENGLDFLKKYTHQDRPPIIVMTAMGNVYVAVESMKLGAADYIVKDSGAMFIEIITNAITAAIEKHTAQQDESEKKKELARDISAFKKIDSPKRFDNP
jgi:DNA-binding response OmpR family regulator